MVRSTNIDQMWAPEFARAVAATMLGATAVGAALLLYWSGFLRCPRTVKAAGELNWAIRLAWPLVVNVSQFWSLAVIALPQWAYAFPPVGAVPDLGQWLGLALWGAGEALIIWAPRVMGIAMRLQVLVLEGQPQQLQDVLPSPVGGV
jgi:hypothetical protein